MPRKCFNCLMCDRDAFRRWFCVVTLDEIPTEQLNTVQENCPIVEVPTPHGRLIDADALAKTIAEHVYPVADYFNSRDYGMFWTGGIEKAINEQSTIIEAEE